MFTLLQTISIYGLYCLRLHPLKWSPGPHYTPWVILFHHCCFSESFDWRTSWCSPPQWHALREPVWRTAVDVLQQPQAAACHWRCLSKTVLCQAGEGRLYPQATGGWSVTQYRCCHARHRFSVWKVGFSACIIYSSKIGLNAIWSLTTPTTGSPRGPVQAGAAQRHGSPIRVQTIILSQSRLWQPSCWSSLIRGKVPLQSTGSWHEGPRLCQLCLWRQVSNGHNLSVMLGFPLQ